jgi:Cdc6-like AAA superfamily ATPase
MSKTTAKSGGRADERHLLRAGEAFRPSAPITSQALFAGRTQEINKVVDAVSNAGQHAAIYGDRGVGKTSLAHVLEPKLASLGSRHLFSKVNCDSADDFTSIWKKAAAEMVPTATFGLSLEMKAALPEIKAAAAAFLEQEALRPDFIRRQLSRLPPSVFVFDEFDRVYADGSVIFADLIKMLSDYVVNSTIVIVGVASTVSDLIISHASTERSVVQVPMPRMTKEELRQALQLASASIGSHFDDDVVSQIVTLAQGLPHYVHALGLYSVRAAIRDGRLDVTQPDLEVAYADATQNASQSLRQEYEHATSSSKKNALFRHVLLACALASKDDVWFRAADVRRSLESIGKPIDIPQFAAHLKSFCADERGPVLEQTGKKKNYRYRFKNPLLEPYVVLQGLATGMIPSVLIGRRPSR